MNTSYQLLVAGSRDFDDQVLEHRVLDALTSVRKPSVVITGGARGADDIGAEWAAVAGVANVVLRPDWKRFGKSAGYRRNEAMVSMLNVGDLVVVFYGPNGVTPGSKHTADLAAKRGIAVKCFAQQAASGDPGAPGGAGVAPQVLNKRAGRAHDGAIYVGRPTKWGNPFPLVDEADRAQVLEQYRAWLYSDENESLRQAAKEQLVGHDLVCWCAPKACHADVLLALANEQVAPSPCDQFEIAYEAEQDSLRESYENSGVVDEARLAEEHAEQAAAFAAIDFECSQSPAVMPL